MAPSLAPSMVQRMALGEADPWVTIGCLAKTRWERHRLPHRGQRHDQPGIDEPLEVRRDGLGEGPVADQDACLDVPVERLRGEIGGGDEHLLVVVDDCLGVEDRPGPSPVSTERGS